MADKRIQIFVSSPGDVGEERKIAERVIQRLQGQFGASVEILPFLWEHAPVRATQHVQEGLKPHEADIVVCMLWWRLGTRLPLDKFAKEDGTAYESGTEYEVDVSIREYRKRGLPELLVYQKQHDPTFPASMGLPAIAEMHEQKKKLDDFIARVFKTVTGELERGWKNFSAVDEFETILENDLAHLIREKLPAVLGHEEHAAVRWHQGSPFVGLRAFGSGDSDIFFGRTRAISEVKEVLLRQDKHFLLILAASGTGKSSLLRAGVLPLITQPGVIRGVGLMRALVIRPSDSGADLVGGLAEALLEGVPELKKLGYGKVEDLARLLRESPALVETPLSAALMAAGEMEGVLVNGQWPHVRLTIGIDQFEEIFTLTGVSDLERERFVAAISALVDSGWVWVIGTMRSDFYAHCASVPKLATMKQGLGLYELLRPTPAEIGQMINNPAKAAGLIFETNHVTGEHLAEVIRSAAVAGVHTLPLLEFLLDELYRMRKDGHKLTFEAYEKLGGLEGAIRERADEEFAALSAGAQDAVSDVLRGLITFRGGDIEQVSGKRALVRELATTPERSEVIERFVAARLLVKDRNENNEPIVGLAHEALLKRWDQVQEIVRDDAHFLRTRWRLEESMARWREEKERVDTVLPEGKLLEEVCELLARRRDDFDADILRFVEASFCEHLRSGLETGEQVEKRYERFGVGGCTDRACALLRELLEKGTGEVKVRVMELVGTRKIGGLEDRLVELAVKGEDKRVRRAACFCLARLGSVAGYEKIITRREEEFGKQALAYLLMAYEQEELAEGFGDKFATLPAGVKRRVRANARGLRLVEGVSTIPYIVIPAALLAALAAGLWKWIPGIFGWALSQPNASVGSGIFHGVTAGIIWAGTISFCLTLHSVVFRNRREPGGLLKPFGAIVFGALGGLVSGFLIVLVIVGVFQMSTLANMGWIESGGEAQFSKPFWYDLFVGTRFGWAYTLTGMGLGAGMAMMTNLIRSRDRLTHFLQGRKALVGLKDIVAILKELFRFVIPFAWPLPMAIAVMAVVVMLMLRPGEQARTYAKNTQVWPTALKATLQGRLIGTVVDCSAEAVGGACAVVGIGLGIVAMYHGVRIQARSEQK